MEDQQVYLISGEDLEKVRQALMSDDITSRANIVFKDAKLLTGREGYYIRVIGTEEQLKRIKEIIGSSAKEIEAKEVEEVLKKIQEEDENALAGFGSIFG
jgi:DNA-binding cell septation regulator SpoVG